MLKRGKINKTLKNIASIIKLKPLFFTITLFSFLIGIAKEIISLILLSLFIGMTGSYSVILGIAKFYGLKKYQAVLYEKDEKLSKKIEIKSSVIIGICTVIITFLYFSFSIVGIFFYSETPTLYNRYVLFFIAGSAFAKIIFAGIMSLYTMKNHNLIIHNIKLADVCLALIALGLTQRAILYYVEYQYADLVSGIGGVFFSLCSAIVCVFMFLRTRRELSNLICP